MRSRILYIVLLALTGIFGTNAENGLGTKMLVFRNTGEINVFNTGEISKIELSSFDKDSIEHEDFVSQVFYQNDSVFTAVPIAEIDSVAFGVRNIIEPKHGVRKLTDEEADCIQSFAEDKITYGQGLTLTKGEIVYYDRMTNMLPYGLCARINEVKTGDVTNSADMEFLDPKDVFDRYILTGEDANRAKGPMKVDYDNTPYKIEFDEEIDGCQVKGHIEVLARCDFEDGVCDFVRGYYHGKLKLALKPELQFYVNSKDSGEINKYLGTPIELNIPALWGAISVGGALQAFVDFDAEMGIEYNVSTELSAEIEWTRRNGKNEFSTLKFNQNPVGDFEQKIEVHLKGELFLGPSLVLQIGTLFDRLGAGAEVKFGPKFEADFSLAAIQAVSEKYNEDVYGKAKIECSLGAKTETFTYRLDHWVLGNKVRTKLPFESEVCFPLRTIELFPDFSAQAVLGKESKSFIRSADVSDAVSVSAYTITELPMPLDVDFEVADADTDETIADVDLDEPLDIPGNYSDDYQSLQTEIVLPEDLPEEQKDRLVARPIINYKGFRVKGKPIDVASDMVFSPMIASFAGNGAYFVSGMTPVSQHTYGDSVTYIEGNHVGVTRIDEKLKGKRTFSVIDFVDLSDLVTESGSLNRSHPLLGHWAGTVMVDQVSLHFIDEKTGQLNDEFFTYQFNSPLNGSIAIRLENGSTVSFSVFELDTNQMTIVPKGSDETFTLTRD